MLFTSPRRRTSSDEQADGGAVPGWLACGLPDPVLDSWWPWAASLFGLLVFAVKTFFVFFANAMVHSVVPRYRYER